MLPDGSVVVLTARTAKGLEETSSLIQREGIEVRLCELDHGRADVSKYRGLVSGLGAEFDSVVLVHNAGSTGKMMPVSSYDDPDQIADYLSLNYTSPAVLNSVVLQVSRPKFYFLYPIFLSNRD